VVVVDQVQQVQQLVALHVVMVERVSILIHLGCQQQV
jgi:hypothetical protein